VRKKWRTQNGKKLEHFIGGQGLQTRKLGSEAALLDLAARLYDLPRSLTVDEMVAEVRLLGCRERCRRAARSGLKEGAIDSATPKIMRQPDGSIGVDLTKFYRREEALRNPVLPSEYAPECPAPRPAAISEFYDSWEWKRLSYETRKARGQRCECCGATPKHGVRIVCDHIRPVRYYWTLRWNRSNLPSPLRRLQHGQGQPGRDRLESR
jgi:hypothetical protein